MKPVIKKETVTPLFESKYIKVFDLEYEKGKHYFDATRRPLDKLMAIKTDQEFKQALPDAVSCVVILKINGEEPKLLLTKEYRYPAGQFLLSPPAGLLDATDETKENPLLATAKREIEEETGLILTEQDSMHVINPLLFSTPGMTDESNALVCAIVHLQNTDALSQEGAVGTEQFDGFELLTKEDALRILRNGKDDDGIFYSIFTWATLMYFVSDIWK